MVPPGKEGMFSRASWDTCSYNERLALSSGTLGYTLSPLPMSNPGQCRNELGLVGGTAVSHVSGDLVDLESDLRGQTRLNGCDQRKFAPTTGRYLTNEKTPPIDTRLRHLGACQMFPVAPVPQPPPVDYNRCARAS